MKPIVFGAWVLTGRAACDDPTQPAEPTVAPPGATVATVEQQLTVRNLGTLGGSLQQGQRYQ